MVRVKVTNTTGSKQEVYSFVEEKAIALDLNESAVIDVYSKEKQFVYIGYVRCGFTVDYISDAETVSYSKTKCIGTPEQEVNYIINKVPDTTEVVTEDTVDNKSTVLNELTKCESKPKKAVRKPKSTSTLKKTATKKVATESESK